MLMMMSAGVLGPLGNYLVPLMIGARRMAFPRVEALTLWLTVLAGFVLLSAILLGGFPTGWTGYAPLADQARGGIDAYLVSFALIGISLVLVGLNMITTVITMRAPGMTWNRMPIFVWGLVTTSILAVLAAPVLFAALFMVVLDRTVDTSFFLATAGGSPFLWDNLFWFFGHPEVYILALPGFGIVLEILPVFAASRCGAIGSRSPGMFGVALMSFMVWQHHLFVSGHQREPAAVLHVHDRADLDPDRGDLPDRDGDAVAGPDPLHRADAVLAAFFFNFLIGGPLGRVPLRRAQRRDDARQLLRDGPLPLHDHGRSRVRADGRAVLLAAEDDRLQPQRDGSGSCTSGRCSCSSTSPSSHCSRRVCWACRGGSRATTPSLHTLNVFVSIAAFCLGASMLVLLANLVWSLVLKREPAEINPWHSQSLEWQLPSPPPVHNFDDDSGDHLDAVRIRGPERSSGRRASARASSPLKGARREPPRRSGRRPSAGRPHGVREHRGSAPAYLRAPSCSCSSRSCSPSSICARSTPTATGVRHM